MHRSPTTLIALALVLTAGATAAAQDAPGWPAGADGWPTYGGTNARAAHGPSIGPTSNNHTNPSVALSGASFGAPVAGVDGSLYYTDVGGVVTKLRPDFATDWTSEPLGGEIRSSATLDPANSIVYATPMLAELTALDAETGAILWQADIGNVNEGLNSGGVVISAAALVHSQGFVVQPSLNGTVHAFTPEGQRLWMFTADRNVEGVDRDNKIVAAPTEASDGTIYVGSQNSFLYALHPDGSLKWKYRTSGGEPPQPPGDQRLGFPEQQVASPTLGADGTIYVTTRVSRTTIGAVYSITDNGDAAAANWRTQLNDLVTAPVAVGPDGGLFVGDISGNFYRLDPSDGSIVWDFNPSDDDPGVAEEIQEDPTDSRSLSAAELAATDAAGRVYIPYWHVDLTKGFPPTESFTSPFYALNQSDGTIAWRDILPKATRSPALVPTKHIQDGVPQSILYLAGDDGNAYAIGDVDAKVTPPGAEVEEPAPTVEPEPTTNGTDNTTAPPPDGTDTPTLPAAALIATLLAIALNRRRRDHP